jgi:hypothetical protein
VTKKEKLNLQYENKEIALAFKEGFFYKVYNEGAFLLEEMSYKIQSNGNCWSSAVTGATTASNRKLNNKQVTTKHF